MRRVSVSFILFDMILIFLFSLNGNSLASPKLKTSYMPGYSIDDIEFIFKTTKSFDDDDLKNIMTLPKLGKFSMVELEQDRLRIKKFYFDNGFFNAVVDTSTIYDDEEQSVTVSLIIIENDRFAEYPAGSEVKNK
jgi:outer membrane protein assembly factor BamA